MSINPKRRFGRRHLEDARDKGFLVRKALKLGSSLRTTRYWSDNGWWGDQGRTPQCVSYAFVAWLEDGPVEQRGDPPCIKPGLLYREAQLHDDIAGENYDGTTVRGAAKALQLRGFIGRYLWAFRVEDVIDTVLERGPVVLGVNWYEGMCRPGNLGLIHPTGEIVGGHAIVCNGINVKAGLARLKNSWGRSWGLDGRCWITLDDLGRLLQEDGEACLAEEITKR